MAFFTVYQWSIPIPNLDIILIIVDQFVGSYRFQLTANGVRINLINLITFLND